MVQQHATCEGCMALEELSHYYCGLFFNVRTIQGVPCPTGLCPKPLDSVELDRLGKMPKVKIMKELQADSPPRSAAGGFA